MNCMLADQTSVPVLGQGTWYLGENPGTRKAEQHALCTGIEAGMTLLDTAEMYGDGQAESLLGEVLPHYTRSDLFLVSKVYPHNAGRRHIFTSCENSLRRMHTDYLDLYLLHWRGSIPLAETIECMEELVRQGKIPPLGRLKLRYRRYAGTLVRPQRSALYGQSGAVPCCLPRY